MEKLYLEDLATAVNVSPGLALLQLIVIEAAQNLVQTVANTPDFSQWLDLIEAILGNKFPDQSLEDIRKMLGLQAEDLSHTRFYHDVFKEGQTELIIRQLGRKLDNLDPSIEKWVKTLSSQQLDLLGEALLNFQDISNLQAWLANLNQ